MIAFLITYCGIITYTSLFILTFITGFFIGYDVCYRENEDNIMGKFIH